MTSFSIACDTSPADGNSFSIFKLEVPRNQLPLPRGKLTAYSGPMDYALNSPTEYGFTFGVSSVAMFVTPASFPKELSINRKVERDAHHHDSRLRKVLNVYHRLFPTIQQSDVPHLPKLKR